MPKKKKSGKKGKSGKKSTKFGRIYGSLIGKGYDHDEAAAIAYKAIGESVEAETLSLLITECCLLEARR